MFAAHDLPAHIHCSIRTVEPERTELSAVRVLKCLNITRAVWAELEAITHAAVLLTAFVCQIHGSGLREQYLHVHCVINSHRALIAVGDFPFGRRPHSYHHLLNPQS